MTQIDLESSYYRNWMPNNNSTNAQASDSDCESKLNSPEIQYQLDIITFEQDPTPETSDTESNTELDTPSPTSIIPALPIVQKSLKTEISLSIRSKIRALRQVASWPFRKIGTELGIPLTTVFNICQQPSTSHRPRMGRPRLLTTPMRKRLIQYATASQENRCKSLSQIAKEAGISVNK